MLNQIAKASGPCGTFLEISANPTNFRPNPAIRPADADGRSPRSCPV